MTECCVFNEKTTSIINNILKLKDVERHLIDDPFSYTSLSTVLTNELHERVINMATAFELLMEHICNLFEDKICKRCHECYSEDKQLLQELL